MSLQIVQENNIVATPRVSVEVAPALVGRITATVQLQAPGRFWLKGTGPADEDDGIVYSGGFVWRLTDVVSNGVEFYEGPVNLYWEGAPDPKTGEQMTSAIVRVVTTDIAP